MNHRSSSSVTASGAASCCVLSAVYLASARAALPLLQVRRCNPALGVHSPGALGALEVDNACAGV